MKRSGPPARKKGLDRGQGPKANPATTRAWQDRSRQKLPAMSPRRKAEKPKRDRVRQEVLARDGGCVARGVLPGRCASPFPDRPPLEVHEVISRGRWAKGYLVADNCRALCQVHHDLVTAEPAMAEKVGLSKSAPQPGLTKFTEAEYASRVSTKPNNPKENPMKVWTVEVVDALDETPKVEQVIGPFETEDEAIAYIDDSWGEYPSDEARPAQRDEADIDVAP